MSEIASLFATLRLEAKKGEWDWANTQIKKLGDGLKRNEGRLRKQAASTDLLGGGLKRLGLAIGAAFGASKGYDALIKFNSTVEDTRLQIAGMMSLATKTDLNDNLSQADKTLANLSARAAKLPGTTAEYASMLGMITQPILDAKLGMQDLEDLTVSAVVASRALGVQGEVAARDIDQAIRGQFRSTDVLTGKLLGSMGFKGEAGRARFNAMDAKKRAETLKQALNQKQIAQLGAAQGETFSGVLSTLQDTVQRFFAKVGLPLFKAITAQLKQWVAWLEKNSAKVEKFANVIASVLMTAFEALGTVVSFTVDAIKSISEDEDIRAAFQGIATAVGYAVKGFIAFMRHGGKLRYVVLGPIMMVVAGMKALGYIINNVGGWFSWLGSTAASVATFIKDSFGAAIDWIAAKVDWVRNKVGWVVDKAKSIGGFVAGAPSGVANAVKSVIGGSPTTVGAAGTASRVVSPSSAGVPPNVNLQAPVTVKIGGNMPPEWIDVKVDQRVRAHSERQWRDVNAAVGGEEQ